MEEFNLSPDEWTHIYGGGYVYALLQIHNSDAEVGIVITSGAMPTGNAAGEHKIYFSEPGLYRLQLGSTSVNLYASVVGKGRNTKVLCGQYSSPLLRAVVKMG